MRADESKRRRRGPSPLDAAALRSHTVSVRLNAAELERLDRLRSTVSMQRGEYLRAGALSRLPPTIPAVNREAWSSLAREAGNLNQLARHLNQSLGGAGEPLDAALARELLRTLASNQRLLGEVRQGLLGAPIGGEGSGGEGED